MLKLALWINAIFKILTNFIRLFLIKVKYDGYAITYYRCKW